MNREGLSPHARDVLFGNRRCIGTSRDGTRCGKAPMVGQLVCDHHGGKTPFGLEAGRKRILALCEPVISVFEEIVATWRASKCPECGNPTGDPTPVIRVGQLVLDRGGFHPSISVAVPPTRPSEHLAWIPREQLAQMNQWIADARAAMERGEPLPDEPRAIDAVLVDTDTDDSDVERQG